MEKTDIDVEAEMAFRRVPTAQAPAMSDDQLSSIGIGFADVAEAGGPCLMLSVTDGEGIGAIALLPAAEMQALLGKMVEVGVRRGILQAEPIGGMPFGGQAN